MSFCIDDEEANYKRQYNRTRRKHRHDSAKSLAKALEAWKERARLAPCEVLVYTPNINEGAIEALKQLIREDGRRRSKPRTARPKRKVLYRYWDLEELGAGLPPEYLTLDEFKKWVSSRLPAGMKPAQRAHEMRKALRPGSSIADRTFTGDRESWGVACDPIKDYKHDSLPPAIYRHSTKRKLKRKHYEDGSDRTSFNPFIQTCRVEFRK